MKNLIKINVLIFLGVACVIGAVISFFGIIITYSDIDVVGSEGNDSILNVGLFAGFVVGLVLLAIWFKLDKTFRVRLSFAASANSLLTLVALPVIILSILLVINDASWSDSNSSSACGASIAYLVFLVPLSMFAGVLWLLQVIYLMVQHYKNHPITRLQAFYAIGYIPILVIVVWIVFFIFGLIFVEPPKEGGQGCFASQPQKTLLVAGALRE